MSILLAPAENPQDGPVLPESLSGRQVDFSPCANGETVRYATVKVIHFAQGGCEIIARSHEVVGGVDRYIGQPCSQEAFEAFVVGRRKPLSERLPEDRMRAAQRAKTAVRRHVRQIGATTLGTFTTREDENTRETLYAKWEEFLRRYRKALGKELVYVAVPERHPSNPKHWHLHVAFAGWHAVKVARKIWWAVCGGDGMGNIHLSDGGPWVRRLPAEKRSMKIASYLSKYLVKAFDDLELCDKKRFSRSTFDAAAVSVIKLDVLPDAEMGMMGAAVMDELRERLGLDSYALGDAISCGDFFLFAESAGFWMQLPAGWKGGAPPF